jgi:hypothetical protein
VGSVLSEGSGAASGQATAKAAEAVAAILGDDEAERRNLLDLMAERLRIVAVRRLAAVAAGGGFTFQHAVGSVMEVALAGKRCPSVAERSCRIP